MRTGAGARSLRSMLVLFALSVIVPATLAVAALITWNAVESRRAHEEQLLATARAISNAVDLQMTSLSAAATAVATAEPVLRNDWPATRARVARLHLGSDVWVAISDQGGGSLLNTSPHVVPASAPQPSRPSNVVRALQSGRPEISNLFMGARTGRAVVAVDEAVENDPAQKVVSLVVASDAIADLLKRQPLPEHALVSLVDRADRVVARTEDHAKFVGVSATPNMITQMDRRSTGVASSQSLDGREKIVAYTRSDLTGWTTMVVLPREEFTRPILQNAVGFILVAILMLMLGIGSARLFGIAISRELKLLEEDAKTVGKGGTVPARLGPIDLINTVQVAISYAGFELERRQRRQELMINELNHRVKNTLATVQAFAVQTFRGSDPVATGKFEKRLAALAGAHDLLIQTEWTSVNIKDVVSRCGEHPGSNIVAVGPSIRLPSEAAYGLCLCLHELVTNSLKYGALSVAEGRVDISWTWDSEQKVLDLTWREENGPRVSEPRRKGFGTKLIDRLCATELNGTVEREYAAAGLIVNGRFQLGGATRWRTDLASQSANANSS